MKVFPFILLTLLYTSCLPEVLFDEKTEAQSSTTQWSRICGWFVVLAVSITVEGVGTVCYIFAIPALNYYFFKNRDLNISDKAIFLNNRT